MNLLQLFLVSWSFTASLSYQIARGVNETLYEPPRINLTNNGAYVPLYVRLCSYSVKGSDGFLFVNMTRYCYCTDEKDDSSCSYPGPTLEMHDDTKITVVIVNQLKGINSTTDPAFHNKFKDMDTTNLHVHGLHVDPKIDNVLLNIEPGYEQSYPYKIGFHYPGTHWYHAHHHGSVTYQVNAGLHGAILMASDAESEMNLTKYKENVLLFNWIYAVPAKFCNNNMRGGINNSACNGTGSNSSTNYEGRFHLHDVSNDSIPDTNDDRYSMCDIYCREPRSQLNASGYVYDVQTQLPISLNQTAAYDDKLLLFFTNGQISPIIRNLTAGIYHRLRFVNSLSNWYIQFKFPDECDWHLIATDGVYIGYGPYMNYKLNNPSHLNEYFMATGGRADMMVRCNATGKYDVYSSNNNKQDPSFLTEQPLKFRIPAGRILFSIEVNNRTHPLPYYNGTDCLPKAYPNKPNGSYIEDLSSLNTSTGLTTECDCNYEGKPAKDCNIFLNFTTNGTGAINGKPFGYDKASIYPYYTDALTIISNNKPYEFKLADKNHVYHQHVNPFQIPDNIKIGNNGFIALPTTWWDTIAYNNTAFPIRFWTRDYYGLIIVHCHLLQHEDVGMMGFYDINYNNSYCPYNTTNTH